MKTRTYTLELSAAQAAYIHSVFGETIPQYLKRHITDSIEGEHRPEYGDGSPDDPPEYGALRRRYDEIHAELGDPTLRNVKVGSRKANTLIAELAHIEFRLLNEFTYTPRRTDREMAA